MGKDRADLLTWSNEQFQAEYELIKQKKSKLPYSQRKQIIDLVEAKPLTEIKPEEIK